MAEHVELLTKKLFPIPHPLDYDPSEEDPLYGYKHVLKPLTASFIRLMDTGLHLDKNAVESLRETIDTILDKVKEGIHTSNIIKEFQKEVKKENYRKLVETQQSKCRNISYYLKEYTSSNIIHRTYVVNSILHKYSIGETSNKWTIAKLKNLIQYLNSTIESDQQKVLKKLQQVVDKQIKPSNIIALSAMRQLATDKLTIYNKSKMIIVEQADDSILIPEFNPNSSKHKTALFRFLNIEPLKFSKKTNEPSWDRASIEEILKTTTNNVCLVVLLKLFIDHSFGAIIKNNFLASFGKFTVGNILKGNLNLGAAKSYRSTSNRPNMLNFPSTGSIYSKPLKRCFTAPKGYLIWAIDFSSLEDKVIANLSLDKNKILTQTDKELDAHLFHATIYFKEEFVNILGNLPHRKLTIAAYKAMKAGNKEIKTLRQQSKSVTFGASYGAYPLNIANSIKCSLEKAQQIFDAYHNEMYPGISAFRDRVISYVEEKNYVHLGLGLKMHTSDIGKEVRSVFNGMSQFWSILTVITLHDLYTCIDANNMQEKVYINSSIYDSIYGYVKNDTDNIKWLNDTIIPIMTTPWLEDQQVQNEAALEIGHSWADLIEIPNNADITVIQTTTQKLEKSND